MTRILPVSPAPALDPVAPSPGNPGPHPSPRRPHLVLPPGSTDSHCHVFGPHEVFPYSPDRTFTPVDAPRQQVAELQTFLGLERAVIVQSSCHGTDHSALLDALRADPERRRGVAILGPEVTAAELEELDRSGVCGARLHFMPHLGDDPLPDEQQSVLAAVADLGWHAEIHVQGSGIVDQESMISAVPGPVVIDHMARVDLTEGLDGQPVRSLTNLLERGNVWVKVSGIDRLSRTGPPYADAVALAALLVARFPERVVWGTDYPHTNIEGDAPDDGLLVDLLARIAPTDAALERLMVTNPAELFGF
ncbi:amidohydrolase family protein [Nocardioides mangrovi]|uniref:Amidohydrolase family protein n=1 Tax=Nocardioides mangrovi TaxID=2874580 RepID=A0ABS7UFA4_9ACTN|nr:amidohydrolase family protein [Nocardioides mangrovi]MBZ5739530.1 amidohydrolase family protein [Nocardioides mangrovi]